MARQKCKGMSGTVKNFYAIDGRLPERDDVTIDIDHAASNRIRVAVAVDAARTLIRIRRKDKAKINY